MKKQSFFNPIPHNIKEKVYETLQKYHKQIIFILLLFIILLLLIIIFLLLKKSPTCEHQNSEDNQIADITYSDTTFYEETIASTPLAKAKSDIKNTISKVYYKYTETKKSNTKSDPKKKKTSSGENNKKIKKDSNIVDQNKENDESEDISPVIENTKVYGKVSTASLIKHNCTITIYQQKSDGSFNVFLTATTQDSGNFSVSLPEGKYNLLFSKPGYLNYTIKGIEVSDSDITIPDIKIIAGDLNGDNSIDIIDLSLLMVMLGLTIDNKNYDEKYVFNSDGIIDDLDKEILLTNYHAQAIEIIWSNT